MITVQIGSKGRAVRFLQVALNTHLRRRPMLRVDGIFGIKTKKAVLEFQKYGGLVVDGIVGQKTWRALLAPVNAPAPSLRKFQTQLRPVSDFVEYVRKLEVEKRSTATILEAVSNFTGTSSGGRYLLIRNAPGVIDFRHFFAAASEAHGAKFSRQAATPIGGGRGDALLLGVANELSQCVDELLRQRLNSCFSPEDLGSNRLGAEFGRSLLISAAENSRASVSQQLQTFLAKLAPQPPRSAGHAALPGFWGTAAESTAAIAMGILDAIIPDAY